MTNILKCIREDKGYSQEELAKELNITRQTLIKYENGENKPSVEIIKKISKIFDIDYEYLIDNKKPPKTSYNIIKSDKKQEKIDIRINIPQENIDKFKQVLLYILKKVGAKPNVGKTVIYKILYFIDFDYYELYEKQLMGLKYIKNTFGPTPVDFDCIIQEMEKSGELEEIKTKFFNKDQTKYLPIKEPDLSLISAQELEHINIEIGRLSDKTATELSEFSHKDIPWIGTEMGEVMEYEAVFYRNEPTSLRIYNDD